MKKILISMLIILMILFTGTVLAANNVSTNSSNKENNEFIDETTSKVLEKKEDMQSELNEYNEKYGSETYGFTAYILAKVRLYSIPFCFIGIAIGAICQYVIGTRRLDMKQKGFGLIITFVTIFVICQALPLVFLVVVKGWRG